MQLSANFTLDEFLFSQTATRLGIDMTPTADVTQNLTALVESVLQPLRDVLDVPIRVTSGFRPLALNTAINGSKTSAHIKGMAADIVVPGMTPWAVAEVLSDMDLIFDQQILEFSSWVHIGISHQPRYERLTAYRDKGRVLYQPGFVEV